MRQQQLVKYLLLPLLLLLPGTWVLMVQHQDLLLADALYALQGGQWSFRHHVLFATVIHQGGRWFTAVLVMVVVAGLIASQFTPRLERWRIPLSYLLLVLITCAVVINVLKFYTLMPCPWDLDRYGGQWQFGWRLSATQRSKGCFPAGHASAGYAWMALYFVALMRKPEWRIRALVFGLALGLVFGLSQQLRGAHFLSHDLWSASLCWYLALFWYLIFNRQNGKIH
jgi:membrane-associated PAP2 superfamily phosphatase